MKQKDIKKLLIEKAKNVQIKDFSYDIIEKFKKLPTDEKIIASPKKRSWRLIPALTLSLSTMAIVLLAWLIYPYFNQETPQPSVLIDIKEDIVLSTIQATSMIEIVETELQAITYETLRFGPVERDSKIKDELKDIAKYLQTIEKIYGSNQSYDIVDRVKDKPGNQRSLQFRTRDLIDHEDIYAFDYEQMINHETLTYHITGNLMKNQKTYPVTITGYTSQKGFLMTVNQSVLNYVVMTFNEEPIKTYTIELFVQGESIQKVDLMLEDVDDEKVATLSFIEGDSSGTYTFKVVEEERKKVIEISYEISFDDEIEKGTITIRILTLPQRTIYSIMVKPEGRIPFTFTQDRGSSMQSSTNI